MTPDLTLSIVSHGHGALVNSLLSDLARNVATPIRVILTINRQEESEEFPAGRAFPFEIEVICNAIPRGFGANHNAALARARSAYFCVLNPDILIPSNPFPVLIEVLSDPHIGVVAPLVTGVNHIVEDHARDFPSVFALASKLIGNKPHVRPPIGNAVYFPDWVAGMFMLLRSDTLRSLGGFDERYFLYYEDVDLCARLREQGFEVAVCPVASVIHDARRASRGNLRYAFWHLRSALRFLASRPRIALGLRRNR